MIKERIIFVFLLIVILSTLEISRLFCLQVLHADLYKALAKGQQEIVQKIRGQRGDIFIKDKSSLVILATSKDSYSCFVNPRKIKDKKKASEKLGEILNISPETIFQEINNDKQFIVLKRRLSADESKAIKGLQIDGIFIKEKPIRYYPHHYLASHLLGFVNQDEKGEYGIEGYWNKTLKGENNFVKKEKGPLGYFFPLPNKKPLSYKGSDLVLTIDFNIQSKAEELLKEAYKNLDIRGGEIIVANPNTGEIIASAEYPNFDPNDYQKYARGNLAIFQNGAIQQLYEPGSVFKAITMASAINEGKVTPQTTYEDKGYVKVGGWIIRNYNNKVWGKETMTQVLEKSINTGAIFAGSQMSHRTFLSYLKKFGILNKTDIDLDGESYSENEDLEKNSDVNFDTAYFGQGIEVTPIQLISAYCALANGGKLVQPHVVSAIINPAGNITKIKPKIISQNVINQNTSSQITEMLIEVTEKGYSRIARIPGYYIASKTGTANIPYSSLKIAKKGYSTQTWQTFIGYFPALDPQFLILVKLDNPKAKTASVSAAPIFKELAQYIINYEQIPPDYDTSLPYSKSSQKE